MTTDRRRFLALSAAAASGVAGCTTLPTGGEGADGSGSDDGSDQNEAIVITEDDITDRVASEVFTDYSWDEMPDERPEPTDRITMPSNYSFEPQIAAVELGQRLTIDNTNRISHRVKIPRVGVDQRLNATDSFTVRFDVTGTFDYLCTFHKPTHFGRIVVQDLG